MGPCVFIAYRGTYYVWACILELTAGSHAADLELATPGGVLKIHAEHLLFDIKENRLQLVGVTVIEPDGQKLLSFSEATFVDFVPGQKTVKGRIRGLRARVTRLKSGVWDPEKYFPKTEGEASQIAFSVRLEDTAIRFVDHAAPGTKPRWISSRDFNIDGFGDKFVAKGQTKIERAGETLLAINKHAGNEGIEVSGDARADLADLAAWLKASPEGRGIDWLKGVEFSAARALGPWTFAMTPKGATFRTDTSVVFADLRYQDYFARAAYAKGMITEQGFDGNLDASESGTKVHFSGRIRWDQEFWMTGELTASAASPGNLPSFARKSLPNGLTFSNGAFTGWLSYRKDLSLQGKLEAQVVKYQGEQLSDGRAWVISNSTTTTLNLDTARFRGGSLAGAAQITNGQLSGFVRAPKVALGPVLRSYGVHNLEGSGSVIATLSGTTAQPKVAFRAEGSATSTLNSEALSLGKFAIRGSILGDAVLIDRATLEGKNGDAYAKGRVNLKSKQLNLEILAKEFPLGVLSNEVAGSASFRGNLSGKFDNLAANGRGEVYGLEVSGQELPVVIADIGIRNDRLTATNLVGFRRSSRVEGNAYLDFKSKGIGGDITASGIQLGEWFPDRVAGILDVTKATIGGTLNSPTLTASLSGRNLVAPGIKIDSGEGEIRYEGGSVQITRGMARSGKGVATGAGTYDLDSQSGTFDLVVESFPLGQLLLESARKLDVDGTVSAKGTVGVSGGEFATLDATGKVNGLKVGVEAIGSGNFAANYEGGKWKGNAMVGQLDSFLEITKLEAEPSTESLSADLTAFNIPVSKVVAVSSQLGLNEEIRRDLARVEGRFDFGGTIGGKWTNPVIESRTLTLDELKLDGVDSGKLEAKFSRNDYIWTIEQLSLAGPGDLNVKGLIDENGDTKLEGSLNNVASEWLGLLIPGIEGIPGRFDVSQFVVDGPTKSPIIQTSIGFKASGTNNRSLDVEARISEGMITADGQYRLDGFTGGITAQIPFAYPFKIAEHEDLLATLNLPDRKLSEFEELWRNLDPTRTQGSISGEVQVKGRPGNLQFSGSARVKPETPNGDVRLAQKDVETFLTNLDATLLFDGENLKMDGSARSSTGGSIQAQGFKVGLNDVFSALVGGDQAKFFTNLVAGNLTADHFQVSQGRGGNANTGAVSGALKLSGMVGEPLISGDIVVESGNLSLPQIEETPPSAPPVIDPRFDVNLRTAMPVRVRAAAGQFDLTGTGELRGSLITPEMTSTLKVRRGSIRLPNARIAVEDGGEVKISYRASNSGLVTSRVDVNIEGQTQLTAERPSGGIERYDIHLTIRGNLLDEKGLLISAESDPSDLSQDRILAMLGQGDFIRGLGLGNSSITDQFRNALIGVALPYLAGSLTDRLAQQLGLDYINVEYNSFDNLSVTAAVAIGKDLILSGRRQISALPGEKVKYDIRLTYRPRFGGQTLRRLRFSIGTDQDRPWKIAIEYGIKF